jgi:intein-encoded DNA endonuclease-like protein
MGMANKDLAYLVGALRDGSVYYYRAGRNYTCAWYDHNRLFLQQSIAARLKRVFNRDAQISQYKPNHYRARIYSKEAYNCFRKEYGYRSPQALWGTPSIIRKADDDVIASYVAGFFDAEGDVSRIDCTIGFSQKNRDALSFNRTWLLKGGLRPSRIFVADKKSRTLRFYLTSRPQLAKFRELVPFEHPDKIAALELRLQQT